jgi:transcriptional regulator with XRE-family HTH domain
MPKKNQGIPEGYSRYRENLAKQIGERLRERRSELLLSQENVRAQLNIGSVHITRSQFSRIETGQRLPDAAELLALAAALDVSVTWLLYGAVQSHER